MLNTDSDKKIAPKKNNTGGNRRGRGGRRKQSRHPDTTSGKYTPRLSKKKQNKNLKNKKKEKVSSQALGEVNINSSRPDLDKIAYELICTIFKDNPTVLSSTIEELESRTNLEDWPLLFEKMDAEILKNGNSPRFLNLLVSCCSYKTIENVWNWLSKYKYTFSEALNDQNNPYKHLSLSYLIYNSKITDEEAVTVVEWMLEAGMNPDTSVIGGDGVEVHIIFVSVKEKPCIYQVLIQRDEDAGNNKRNFLHKEFKINEFEYNTVLRALCANYSDSEKHKDIIKFIIKKAPELLLEKREGLDDAPLAYILTNLNGSNADLLACALSELEALKIKLKPEFFLIGSNFRNTATIKTNFFSRVDNDHIKKVLFHLFSICPEFLKFKNHTSAGEILANSSILFWAHFFCSDKDFVNHLVKKFFRDDNPEKYMFQESFNPNKHQTILTPFFRIIPLKGELERQRKDPNMSKNIVKVVTRQMEPGELKENSIVKEEINKLKDETFSYKMLSTKLDKFMRMYPHWINLCVDNHGDKIGLMPIFFSLILNASLTYGVNYFQRNFSEHVDWHLIHNRFCLAHRLIISPERKMAQELEDLFKIFKEQLIDVTVKSLVLRRNLDLVISALNDELVDMSVLDQCLPELKLFCRISKPDEIEYGFSIHFDSSGFSEEKLFVLDKIFTEHCSGLILDAPHLSARILCSKSIERLLKAMFNTFEESEYSYKFLLATNNDELSISLAIMGNIIFEETFEISMPENEDQLAFLKKKKFELTLTPDSASKLFSAKNINDVTRLIKHNPAYGYYWQGDKGSILSDNSITSPHQETKDRLSKMGHTPAEITHFFKHKKNPYERNFENLNEAEKPDFRLRNPEETENGILVCNSKAGSMAYFYWEDDNNNHDVNVQAQEIFKEVIQKDGRFSDKTYNGMPVARFIKNKQGDFGGFKYLTNLKVYEYKSKSEIDETLIFSKSTKSVDVYDDNGIEEERSVPAYCASHIVIGHDYSALTQSNVRNRVFDIS